MEFTYRKGIYQISDILKLSAYVLTNEKKLEYSFKSEFNNWAYDRIKEYMEGKRRNCISNATYNKWIDRIEAQIKENKPIKKRKFDF